MSWSFLGWQIVVPHAAVAGLESWNFHSQSFSSFLHKIPGRRSPRHDDDDDDDDVVVVVVVTNSNVHCFTPDVAKRCFNSEIFKLINLHRRKKHTMANEATAPLQDANANFLQSFIIKGFIFGHGVEDVAKQANAFNLIDPLVA